ncbi:hypothetical protein CIT26_05290 [Mesorhizobium temperatum]|uniref:Uncharacterized protein n=1 Tax=Mesorhizobium temperatum TaxID=241416 RepID=A0A271LUE5_9HYPH|nr:hypothetical protein CIT26_05290 [Mesorhizobium temperatum]
MSVSNCGKGAACAIDGKVAIGPEIEAGRKPSAGRNADAAVEFVYATRRAQTLAAQEFQA